MNPLISVVITTKNSSRTLGKCLKSIRNQSYNKIELIVVDNNSLDDTKKIAKRFTKKVFNKGPERSAQRNYGARKAKGNYVLIHDSDIYFHKKSLEECVNLAEKTGCKAIILPERSIGKGYWVRVKDFERSFYKNNDLIEAARFFDKKTFFKLGGYDENLTGPEDWDLTVRFRKAGYDIRRTKSELLHDEGCLNLFGSSKKKQYYSHDFEKYKRKHPKIFNQQMSFFNRFKPKDLLFNFVRHPILTFSMFLMKGLEWLNINK